MTDAVLAEVLARLDLVVFERLPGGLFVRFGPAAPPAWFSRLSLTSVDETSTIEQTMPFLGHFLADAGNAWHAGGDTRLRSEPFTVTDTAGEDVTLVAWALVVANRCFLIVESPADFEDRRRDLQIARERALAHEEHVWRTGALMTPLEAARRLAEQLSSSGLDANQQKLAAGIVEHLASLSASILSLAPPSKGVSRPVRR